MDIEDFRSEMLESCPVLWSFWRLVEKNVDGTIGFEEFTRVKSAICKALLDCKDEDAKRLGEMSRSSFTPMKEGMFNNWVLSVADLYCQDFDKAAYTAFLTLLKNLITEVVINDANRKYKLVPRVSVVHADSPEALNALQISNMVEDTWSAFDASEHQVGNVSGEISYLSTDNGSTSSKNCRVVAEKLCPLANIPKLADTAPLTGEDLESSLLDRYQSLFQGNQKQQLSGVHLMSSAELSKDISTPRFVLDDERFKNAVVAGKCASPKIWVIGLPKTGKTTVANNLAEKLGGIYIDGTSQELNRQCFVDALNQRPAYVLDGGHCSSLCQSIVDQNDDVSPNHLIVLTERDDELSKRGACVSAVEESRQNVEKLLAMVNPMGLPRFTSVTFSGGHGLEDLQCKVFCSLGDANPDAELPLPRLAFAQYFNTPRTLLYTENEEGEEVELSEDEETLRRELMYEGSTKITKQTGSEEEGDQEETVTHSPETYSFRCWSSWGTICPVTCESGSAKYAVLYQGKVFLCSTKEAMKQFIKQPKPYTSAKQLLPGQVVVIADDNVNLVEAEAGWNKFAKANKLAIHATLPEEVGDREAYCQGLIADDNKSWILCVPKASAIEVPGDFLSYFADTLPRSVVFLHNEKTENVSREAWSSACGGNNIPFASFKVTNDLNLDMHNVLNVYRTNSEEAAFVEHLKTRDEESQNAFVNARLGWSGKYCPVTLVNENRLVPGISYGMKKSSFYRFADEAAHEAFNNNPRKFQTPVPRPKPVVLVLGPPGAGKTTTSLHLKEMLNLPVLNSLPEQVVAEGDNSGAVEEKKEGEEEEDAPGEVEVDPNQVWLEGMKTLLENHRKSGCVLDGLVKTPEQLDLLLDSKLHPTICLNLDVNEETSIARTMKKRFAWTPPEPRVEEEEKENEETGEVEMIQTVVPWTAEELEEMKQQATDELTNEISAEFGAASQFAVTAVERLSSLRVVVAPTVDMTGPLAHCLRMLRSHVKRITPCENGTKSLEAHRAVEVSPEMAQKLLHSGLIQAAPLGHYCPVILTEEGRLDKSLQPNMVVYNGLLYQTSSRQRMAKFLSSPDFYRSTDKRATYSGVRASRRCAIVGSEKSTVIARELARVNGLVVINPKDCVSEASKLDSSFGEYVREEMSTFPEGDYPTELAVQCIAWAVSQSTATDAGFVLDSYPTNRTECEMLDKHNLLPDCFFFLNGGSSNCSPKDLSGLERFINSLELKYSRCYHLNPNKSPWSLSNEVNKVLNDTVKYIQKLFRVQSKVVQEQMARAQTKAGLVARRLDSVELVGLDGKPDAEYCLVSFVQKNRQLVPGCKSQVALYNGKLYAFANSECLAAFQKDPEVYLKSLLEYRADVAKLPPSPEELLKDNKIVEYLEMTVTPLMNQALVELGKLRLKHPCLSVRETALKFMALFLRANNPNVKCPHRQKVLASFIEECELFDNIRKDDPVAGTGLHVIRQKKKREDLLERFQTLLKQPNSILAARLLS